MLLTYQYKLNPTNEQSAIMEVWGELLRRHWNYALGQRLDWLRRTRTCIDRCSIVSEPIGDRGKAWKNKPALNNTDLLFDPQITQTGLAYFSYRQVGEIPERVDYYTQASGLRQTKELFLEYKSIYADCQQQNLMRLDKAWLRWLIPDKNGKRGGKPRFKKRGDICSFTFPRVNCPKAGAHLIGNVLKLSKIGEINLILHRPIPDGFTLKQATIICKADGWYVSLAMDDATVPEPLPVGKIKNSCGIDVGLEKFLTTSDGQSIEIPQHYRKGLEMFW